MLGCVYGNDPPEFINDNGTISQITSIDGSVIITNEFGPITDLSVTSVLAPASYTNELLQWDNTAMIWKNQNVLTPGGIAIGDGAETFPNAISIGNAAGTNGVGPQSINIGVGAGSDVASQGIAIGSLSGAKGIGSICIGNNSGENNCGDNSVCLGSLAGQNNAPNNSFFVNSSCIRKESQVLPVAPKNLLFDRATGELYENNLLTGTCNDEYQLWNNTLGVWKVEGTSQIRLGCIGISPPQTNTLLIGANNKMTGTTIDNGMIHLRTDDTTSITATTTKIILQASPVFGGGNVLEPQTIPNDTIALLAGNTTLTVVPKGNNYHSILAANSSIALNDNYGEQNIDTFLKSQMWEHNFDCQFDNNQSLVLPDTVTEVPLMPLNHGENINGDYWSYTCSKCGNIDYVFTNRYDNY